MYRFKVLSEISKVPFEILYKILNLCIAKYAFYEVLKVCQHMTSKELRHLSLSETGPRGLGAAVTCAILSAVYPLCSLLPRQTLQARLIQFTALTAEKNVFCAIVTPAIYFFISVVCKKTKSVDNQKFFTIYLSIYAYMYIYIYVCLCVLYVNVWIKRVWRFDLYCSKGLLDRLHKQ